jgi:hypothetical protein
MGTGGRLSDGITQLSADIGGLTIAKPLETLFL